MGLGSNQDTYKVKWTLNEFILKIWCFMTNNKVRFQDFKIAVHGLQTEKGNESNKQKLSGSSVTQSEAKDFQLSAYIGGIIVEVSQLPATHWQVTSCQWEGREAERSCLPSV